MLLQSFPAISVKPVQLRMSFNNDNSASADGIITLEANDSQYSGTYDIMWGDANGVMSNYSKIDSLTLDVADNKTSGTIEMSEFNAIPKYATRLCAVKNNEIVCDFVIPASKLWDATEFGEHLYSFGLLSDVHIQYQTGHDDVQVAMTYLNERESVDAICISGDLTMYGTTEHLEEWKTDRDTWADNTPVYACNGNHEAYNATSVMKTAPDTIRPYLDSDYSESTGDPYFYKVINNDVFAFVPIFEGAQASVSAVMFSENCISWLTDLLETYRNQRVFVFAHVPPHSKHTKYNGFGIGNMAYSYDIWGYSSNANRDAFLSLMAHYKNAIWFNGHSHIKYEYQKLWEDLNVCRYNNGARFVHVSSLTVPRDIIDGSVTNYIYAESEGAVVDVYANAIRVRNRNFVGEKFYGLCEYLIDTTPVTIPPATKTVVSISARKTKTAYYTDESLSTADITVTATYSDSSTDDVSSEAVFNTSAVTISTAGTYTIGVSYTYEGDTVTTTVQVTSSVRPTSFKALLDATFSGQITAANRYAAAVANNDTTVLSGSNPTNKYAICLTSEILNKPLYYRILSNEGLDRTNKVGFVGAASSVTGTYTNQFPDYSLDTVSSEWQPLVRSADPAQQLVIESPNDRIWVALKSSNSSTATFPVTVNARIQIGIVDDTPYTTMLDATFAEEITTQGGTVANITANNNTTAISGYFAYCNDSTIMNKPLYYRLLSDTGLSVADAVGYRGAASTQLGGSPSGAVAFTDYSLDSTDWQPLMEASDPTTQIVVESPNDRIWIQCRSSSVSTATFPVTINSRIQIGYRNGT